MVARKIGVLHGIVETHTIQAPNLTEEIGDPGMADSDGASGPHEIMRGRSEHRGGRSLVTRASRVV
jgi:hypothetical protein